MQSKKNGEKGGRPLTAEIFFGGMRINKFPAGKTLIFSFSHHTERKRSASYRNKVEMLHIV